MFLFLSLGMILKVLFHDRIRSIPGIFKDKLLNMIKNYILKRVKIQLKSDQTERLLNKPYVNEVHLTGQNLI